MTQYECPALANSMCMFPVESGASEDEEVFELYLDLSTHERQRVLPDGIYAAAYLLFDRLLDLEIIEASVYLTLLTHMRVEDAQVVLQ